MPTIRFMDKYPECETCINREFDPSMCETCVDGDNYEGEDDLDSLTAFEFEEAA